MPDHLNGLAFNQRFYEEIAAPILKTHFPGLAYSAALIGWGSDVLGYDDLQSTDHNWGVRFQIFLSEPDYEKYSNSIIAVLDDELPSEFHGFPTAFKMVGNADQPGMSGTSKQNVDVESIPGFFHQYLGCDPYAELSAVDWLTFSEHKLLSVTSGRVFHDELGELEPIRQKFAYYPKDVWLYMLAAQWEKIFEEQAFVGRCGYVGDDLGSMLIAVRQVRNLMQLCFLMERKYAPYSKWFGTAFNHLDCAGRLGPIFLQVLRAQEWEARQKSLGEAYGVVAGMHNGLGSTFPMQEKAAQYFDRPYLVMGDGRYADELMKSLTSDELTSIEHRLGSINQFVDSHDQLNNLDICTKLKAMYA